MYDEEFVLDTQEGMELLLTGTYDIISGSSYLGTMMILYEAAKGPDFFTRDIGGGKSLSTENRYDESRKMNGNAKTFWQTIYLAIRNTTLLIENIDYVKGDIETLRRIKGEAYAIRGLCYFDLMRLFARPPMFSCTWGTQYQDKFKWGVPVIRNVKMGTDILDYEIRRETADYSYGYIVDQLERAVELLDGRGKTNGRVDDAAARALLMRAYLYMQRWDDVITLGEEWMTKHNGNYHMIDYDSYPTTYYQKYNTESVWELGYTTSDNISGSSVNGWVRKETINKPGHPDDGKTVISSGYAKLGLTWGNATRGMDFLKYYADDVRQYLICDLDTNNFPEWKTIRKYVGDPYHGIHNIPLVRLPEIYLTLAEAYANKNNMGKATEYASLVSQPRRKAAASVTSASNVLDERRREFILEGHTFWDYHRTNRNISNRQVIEVQNDATITFVSSTRVVYPIPYAEMMANVAMRDQQNEGYGGFVFEIEQEE
jgi:hypothetical protein